MAKYKIKNKNGEQYEKTNSIINGNNYEYRFVVRLRRKRKRSYR